MRHNNLNVFNIPYVVFRNRISFFYKKMKSLFFKRKKVILSRTACLGNDIKKILFTDAIDFNFQKSRIDGILSGRISEICFLDLVPFIARKDIFDILLGQRRHFFSVSRPDYIFIDSYSELTDQKFIIKENNKEFFCNYSDVSPESNKQDVLKCEGLLELENVKNLYENFFRQVTTKYPGVPIIFIHFPYALEKREKMIKRAMQIKQSLEELALKYKDLYSFSLDESSNEVKRVDEMPYHYQKETYDAFSRLIKERILIHG